MIIAAFVLYLALYGAVDFVNSASQKCHECIDKCLKNAKNDRTWEALHVPVYYKCEESCCLPEERRSHIGEAPTSTSPQPGS